MLCFDICNSALLIYTIYICRSHQSLNVYICVTIMFFQCFIITLLYHKYIMQTNPKSLNLVDVYTLFRYVQLLSSFMQLLLSSNSFYLPYFSNVTMSYAHKINAHNSTLISESTSTMYVYLQTVSILVLVYKGHYRRSSKTAGWRNHILVWAKQFQQYNCYSSGYCNRTSK